MHFYTKKIKWIGLSDIIKSTVLLLSKIMQGRHTHTTLQWVYSFPPANFPAHSDWISFLCPLPMVNPSSRSGLDENWASDAIQEIGCYSWNTGPDVEEGDMF